MTDADIDVLVPKAINLLKATSSNRMGNGKLRTLMELDENQYDDVKQAIIDGGLATSGRGRGGSLILTNVALAPQEPILPEPIPSLPPKAPTIQEVAPPLVAQTRKPPYQVSGRDFASDDLVEDDVVRVFTHRPYNNRNEYCMEIFDVLKQRARTYLGIRRHRQEVDRALREQRNISTDILTTIHESANEALRDLDLVIDSNIGLVRCKGED